MATVLVRVPLSLQSFFHFRTITQSSTDVPREFQVVFSIAVPRGSDALHLAIVDRHKCRGNERSDICSRCRPPLEKLVGHEFSRLESISQESSLRCRLRGEHF